MFYFVVCFVLKEAEGESLSKAASFLSLGGSAGVGAAHHAVEAGEIVDLMAKIMKVLTVHVCCDGVGGREGGRRRESEFFFGGGGRSEEERAEQHGAEQGRTQQTTGEKDSSRLMLIIVAARAVCFRSLHRYLFGHTHASAKTHTHSGQQAASLCAFPLFAVYTFFFSDLQDHNSDRTTRGYVLTALTKLAGRLGEDQEDAIEALLQTYSGSMNLELQVRTDGRLFDRVVRVRFF